MAARDGLASAARRAAQPASVVAGVSCFGLGCAPLLLAAQVEAGAGLADDRSGARCAAVPGGAAGELDRADVGAVALGGPRLGGERRGDPLAQRGHARRIGLAGETHRGGVVAGEQRGVRAVQERVRVRRGGLLGVGRGAARPVGVGRRQRDDEEHGHEERQDAARNGAGRRCRCGRTSSSRGPAGAVPGGDAGASCRTRSVTQPSFAGSLSDGVTSSPALPSTCSIPVRARVVSLPRPNASPSAGTLMRMTPPASSTDRRRPLAAVRPFTGRTVDRRSEGSVRRRRAPGRHPARGSGTRDPAGAGRSSSARGRRARRRRRAR